MKWELYRRFPGRSAFRIVASMLLVTKVSRQKKIISFFPEYDGEFSWLALNSDGGSVQVFDVPNRKVIKTISSYKVDNENLKFEISCRARIPNNVPKVELRSVNGNQFIVEDWVTASHRPPSMANLKLLLRFMKNEFYAIETYTRDDYWLLLKEQYPESMVAEIINLFLEFQIDEIPVSVVHGDFVAQNIVYENSRSFNLIDWEYCRRDFVAYDAWLYVYDLHGQDRCTDREKFFVDLREAMAEIGLAEEDANATDAICYKLRSKYTRQGDRV